MTKIVYPGSFDPVTLGHLDIIYRGLHVFDHIIIAVAKNMEKKSLFSVQERKTLIKESLGDLKHVTIDSFEGLLMDYVKNTGASAVLRGLRATSDFEYEFHMASMNRHLEQHIDTFFMMTSRDYFFVSSRTIKEVAMLGGNVSGLVPPNVESALKDKFSL
jgi:pantetheine-phosphate adenylyltransferase